MTNQEKANLYEIIISEGDKLNREKSKIKAENAGINISPENQKRLSEIDQRLSLLENRLNELIR
jgi:Zn-dependent oligopeptidase